MFHKHKWEIVESYKFESDFIKALDNCIRITASEEAGRQLSKRYG